MATQMIEAERTMGSPDLVGAHVLVVDDSPSMLAFASSALQRAGCEVQTSGDIWIASVITDFQPDLVLIDVNLAGGCSGPTVIRALKKRDLGHNIRFVLYSTASIEELDLLAASCGADGRLHKDGDPDALIGEVARVLGRA